MAKVSISEAARLAAISRSHLYAKFIKPGKISIETIEDALGKPQKRIDTSELTRVFGNLARTEDTTKTGQVRTPVDTHEDTQKPGQDTCEDRSLDSVLQERVRGLEALLKAKDESLEQAQSERARLIGIIERQTLLLTHQPTPGSVRGLSKTAWALLVVLVAAGIAFLWPDRTASKLLPTKPQFKSEPQKPAPKPDGEPWKPDGEGG